MLVKENSILRHVPNLQEKQLLTLDSLRFTLEMVDYSYQNILKQITSISKDSSQKNYPQLFHYTWTFLDSIRRFVRLYKLLPTNDGHLIVKSIENINSPRNTYQHLDERIDESLISSRRPFYGALKWTYHDSDANEAFTYVAISGLLYGDPGEVKFEDFDKSKPIDPIILETVDRNKKMDINLSEVYKDIIEVVKNLEEEIAEKVEKNNHQLVDWKSRQDVLLRIKRTIPE
ncbi:hypothetical protein [Maribacter litoralis]|uniref:Uncharacterized protein n=1 Tax=Maribacter litoralis TaxID=2059726 RepID=A0A653LN99_9FLAO|nr:hypothetical protein [Maribacter litoralis]VXA93487.1 conserved hypothetical protein [Maribacter litoralis]